MLSLSSKVFARVYTLELQKEWLILINFPLSNVMSHSWFSILGGQSHTYSLKSCQDISMPLMLKVLLSRGPLSHRFGTSLGRLCCKIEGHGRIFTAALFALRWDKDREISTSEGKCVSKVFMCQGSIFTYASNNKNAIMHFTHKNVLSIST